MKKLLKKKDIIILLVLIVILISLIPFYILKIRLILMKLIQIILTQFFL